MQRYTSLLFPIPTVWNALVPSVQFHSYALDAKRTDVKIKIIDYTSSTRWWFVGTTCYDVNTWECMQSVWIIIYKTCHLGSYWCMKPNTYFTQCSSISFNMNIIFDNDVKRNMYSFFLAIPKPCKQYWYKYYFW